MTCHDCGRVGKRGFRADDTGRNVCADREACQRRQAETTPARKFAQIRALIDDQSLRDMPGSYLARRVRKVLDK